VIFQSVESPNLHPPPGQPETERPNSDPPPAVLFTSFQLPTSKMLLKHIQFCMKVAPKHVQELLRRAVWELSRSISQPKHGWIGSLQGASLVSRAFLYLYCGTSNAGQALPKLIELLHEVQFSLTMFLHNRRRCTLNKTFVRKLGSHRGEFRFQL
jgi:hypothetical protein